MKFTKGGELRPEGFVKAEYGITGNLKIKGSKKVESLLRARIVQPRSPGL
jgi:hypothetical protein